MQLDAALDRIGQLEAKVTALPQAAGSVEVITPTEATRIRLVVTKGQLYLRTQEGFERDLSNSNPFDFDTLRTLVQKATEITELPNGFESRIGGDALSGLSETFDQLTSLHDASEGKLILVSRLLFDDGFIAQASQVLLIQPANQPAVEASRSVATLVEFDEADKVALTRAISRDALRQANVDTVGELTKAHQQKIKDATEIAFTFTVTPADGEVALAQYRTRKGVLHTQTPGGSWEPQGEDAPYDSELALESTRVLLSTASELKLHDLIDATEVQAQLPGDLLEQIDPQLGLLVQQVAQNLPGAQLTLFCTLQFDHASALLTLFRQELWLVDPAANPSNRERIFTQELNTRLLTP